MKTIFTSEAELAAFAKTFAEKLSSPSSGATVVALTGDLGSGKTTFVKHVLGALGVLETVISPTFVLVREYPISKAEYAVAYHIDVYRLAQAEEIFDLGLSEILQNPQAIVFIEWADRIKDQLPSDALWLSFEHGKDEQERSVEVVY